MYPHTPGYKEKSTSRDAAVAITPHAKTVRELVKNVYRQNYHRTFTADEVALLLEQSILTVRPRVTELLTDGFIEDSGERRSNDSGHMAKAYRWHGEQERLF